ncbi:MalY/PatB family protein [Stackebrandtia soli]|uniref:MalY/PatB family protein n=1 Tax=Stackebrandtia soli TaxID=1892856 RepID=UPI0039E7A739
MTETTVSPFEELSLESLRRRRSVKWRMYDPDVLPLWVAEMDTPLAPPIQSALNDAVALGDTGYAIEGDLPAAFVGFAARRYGWTVDGEAPRLVADVMTGVRIALGACTDVGDRVVISTPVYPPFFEALHALDRVIVSSPLAYDVEAGHSLDLDRLERDFADGASAYLLCHPHNPTGIVFDRAGLAAIADLAERYGVTVIADEIHAPLTDPAIRHVPFASLDHPVAAASFTCVAASKAWNLPGLKAALLVPGSLADTSAFPEELWAGAGLFGVIAAEAAFREGEEWLDLIRAGIVERKRLLSELLADRLPDARYREPAGTYLAWIDMRAYGMDDPATFLAERGRVALYSGTKFGSEGAGFVRLNLATSKSIIIEAVDRMAAVLKS